MTYLLFLIVPLIFGFWAQRSVTTNFRRYSEVAAASGMSGAQVARMILDRNGLNEVEVLSTPGELSDHYDPRSRTVNLSESVYGQRSVAAISVAAHEVGHALQHQKSYAPLAIRSALVPVANLGSRMWSVLLILGMVLMWMQSVIGLYAILLGIALYSFAVLFHIVTLPVEFDASRRAKRQLNDMALVTVDEANGATAVLRAAAMTYVAGALAAIAQLMYWVMVMLGNR